MSQSRSAFLLFTQSLEHALHALLDDDLGLRARCSAGASGFTRTLARVLGRPAILHMPSFALRLLAGEMANEALLASARVEPERLEKDGFRFEDAELEPALRKLLARP